MSEHLYISNPELFVDMRSEVKPVDPSEYYYLFGLVAKKVLSRPSFYFRQEESDRLNRVPMSLSAIRSYREHVAEATFPEQPDATSEIVARIFTPHSLEARSTGVDALVGYGKENVLNPWILSSDGSKQWITDAVAVNPITDFDASVLAEVLTS